MEENLNKLRKMEWVKENVEEESDFRVLLEYFVILSFI